MDVIRYKGELLVSQYMRAKRMKESCIFCGIRYGADVQPFDKNSSFRFPFKDPREQSLHPTRYFNDLYEGTAWPLLSLLWGFDLHCRYDPSDRFFKRSELHTEENLKFCPACATIQRLEYGISWWIRDINLPFVSMCSVHCIPLHYSARQQVFSTLTFPHEWQSEAKPVAARYCGHADLIGQSVIALCRRSADLDPEAVKRLAARHWSVLGGIGKLRAVLGLTSQFAHPWIGGRQRSAQDHVNDLQHHDGLTKNGNADLILALVLTAFDKSMKVLDQLIAASYSFYLLPRSKLKIVLIELIPKTRYRKAENPLECIQKYCQLKLDGDRFPPYKLRDRCIEILILQELAPDWLAGWMKKNAPSASFFPLSDWRICIALNVFRFIMQALDRYRAEAPRYPVIQKYMRDDKIVLEWERSFIQACVEKASGFLAEIARGRPGMYPRPEDYSIKPA